MKQIRIEWTIGSNSGSGSWRDDTESEHQNLLAWVIHYNLKYGEGTHRLVSRVI